MNFIKKLLDSEYKELCRFEKLAEEIEVSVRYISDIEQDKSKPSYEVLIKICNIFRSGNSFADTKRQIIVLGLPAATWGITPIG